MGKSKRFKKGSLPRQPKVVDASVVHEITLPAGGGGGHGLPGVNETVRKATSAFEGTGYLPAEVDPKARPLPGVNEALTRAIKATAPASIMKPFAHGGIIRGGKTSSVSKLELALYESGRRSNRELLDRINTALPTAFKDEAQRQRWADQARARRNNTREAKLWRGSSEYVPCYAEQWRRDRAAKDGVIHTGIKRDHLRVPFSSLTTNPSIEDILFGRHRQRAIQGVPAAGASVMVAPVGTKPSDTAAWRDIGRVSSVSTPVVTQDSVSYSVTTSDYGTSSSDCSAASVDCGGSF
jgi:hypothetical protein